MLLICRSLPAVSWLALSVLASPGCPEGVAVYRVPIAENQAYAPRLFRLLPVAEQQRAHRYHTEADYYRFVIGRAALRLLLGARLGLPATELAFVPGTNKKPVLAAAPGLHYNVSHSGNWVLIAIAPVEIGIDLEKINAAFPFQEVLEHSFSAPEKAFITRQPAPAATFYQLWTRKEALVKATAQGIDADFAHVPALDGLHHWPASHPSPITDWAVGSFEPTAGYVAALAYPAAWAGQLQFYEVGDHLDHLSRPLPQ